jgi:alpha-glucosidase
MYAMIMMVIPCSHRKAHNIYGTQMETTYHGVKRFAYPKDLLLLRDQLMLERNAPPHGQEIIFTWEHLDSQYPKQRMSISGWVLRVLILEVLQNNPQELYARWIQLTSFL